LPSADVPNCKGTCRTRYTNGNSLCNDPRLKLQPSPYCIRRVSQRTVTGANAYSPSTRPEDPLHSSCSATSGYWTAPAGIIVPTATRCSGQDSPVIKKSVYHAGHEEIRRVSASKEGKRTSLLSAEFNVPDPSRFQMTACPVIGPTTIHSSSSEVATAQWLSACKERTRALADTVPIQNKHSKIVRCVMAIIGWLSTLLLQCTPVSYSPLSLSWGRH
jgi:hypothetical protein